MPANETMNMCGSGKLACIKDAQIALVADPLDPPEDFIDYKAECNCLPSCYSVDYNAETSQSAFDWKKVFQALGPLLPEEYANST